MMFTMLLTVSTLHETQRQWAAVNATETKTLQKSNDSWI